jgi:hypothetical protein
VVVASKGTTGDTVVLIIAGKGPYNDGLVYCVKHNLGKHARRTNQFFLSIYNSPLLSCDSSSFIIYCDMIHYYYGKLFDNLPREADRMVSGASGVVAMAVTQPE